MNKVNLGNSNPIQRTAVILFYSKTIFNTKAIKLAITVDSKFKSYIFVLHVNYLSITIFAFPAYMISCNTLRNTLSVLRNPN